MMALQRHNLHYSPPSVLRQRVQQFAVALALAALCLPTGATTKGLNQIVTPDIQPEGILSLSYQAQHPALGNSQETQYELGLTKRVEVAVFTGYKPGVTVYNAEYGLVQKKSFLLSTGVLNVERGMNPQPFLEGGYYKGKASGIIGVEQQQANPTGVFGFGYQATPKALITADYITGDKNFATAGVTFTLTSRLTFNPAVYISNDSSHRAYAYGVLSWSVNLWKPRM